MACHHLVLERRLRGRDGRGVVGRLGREGRRGRRDRRRCHGAIDRCHSTAVPAFDQNLSHMAAVVMPMPTRVVEGEGRIPVPALPHPHAAGAMHPGAALTTAAASSPASATATASLAFTATLLLLRHRVRCSADGAASGDVVTSASSSVSLPSSVLAEVVGSCK